MGLFYTIMGVSFFVLVIINLVVLGLVISYWATYGLQSLLQGRNFIESIYFSIYLKWVVIADFGWILLGLIFVFKRKDYQVKSDRYYLKYSPIKEPRICMILPAYNEELSIEKVIMGFESQKAVKKIIIVDNNSEDNTVKLSEKHNVQIIKKEKNTGWADSAYLGMKKALETDCNIIGLAESDGTANAYDIEKMLPYLDNCDFVVGSRMLQVLSEKGTQLRTKDVWGNFILAKLIQLKFFSLNHLGIMSLTDVGSIFKLIRKESLESIINTFTDPKTNKLKPDLEINLFMIVEALKNNLRIIEVPVSFNKRIGTSKIGTPKLKMAVKLGFLYLRYILRS